MFKLITSPHRFCRHYLWYAATGCIIIGLGYLIRAQFVPPYPALILLLGVFPNLVGSFATPFALLLLLYPWSRTPQILTDARTFSFVNLFTFAGCILIEVAHVVFRIGVFDRNDMLASIIGAGAALVLFRLTGRGWHAAALVDQGISKPRAVGDHS